MGALILGCGAALTSADWPKLASASGCDVREIPATPGKSDVDPLIQDLADGQLAGRIVVHGTDADLAAVVLRLLRLERLDLEVGYVPVGPSPVARLWGLPRDRVATALDGPAGPVPLIRDDNGGVLLGLGVLAPVRGTVLCDDEEPVRGAADRVEVAPDLAGGPGLSVTVIRKSLLRKRSTTFTGRAAQFGGEPLAPVRDGVVHPRTVPRWTWYRHTADLIAVGQPAGSSAAGS
jgi:hypothetical protein